MDTPDPDRDVVPLTYGTAGQDAPRASGAGRWWPAALAAAAPVWIGLMWLTGGRVPGGEVALYGLLIGCPAANLVGIGLGVVRLGRPGDRAAGIVVVLLNALALASLVAVVVLLLKMLAAFFK